MRGRIHSLASQLNRGYCSVHVMACIACYQSRPEIYQRYWCKKYATTIAVHAYTRRDGRGGGGRNSREAPRKRKLSISKRQQPYIHYVGRVIHHRSTKNKGKNDRVQRSYSTKQTTSSLLHSTDMCFTPHTVPPSHRVETPLLSLL